MDLVEFPERGHALLDGSFDLLSVIAASKVFQGIPLSTGKPLPSIQRYLVIRFDCTERVCGSSSAVCCESHRRGGGQDDE